MPALALAVLLVLLAVGCQSTEYVQLRKIPRNPLEDSLQLLSPEGPAPTWRTQQFLRRWDLESHFGEGPREFLARVQQCVNNEPIADNLYALAELSYIEAKKAETRHDTLLAFDLYGSALTNAYFYLFDERYAPSRNPYDPQFRQVCDLYNGSLEAAMRIIQDRGELQPGQLYKVKTSSGELEVAVVLRGKWQPEEIEHFAFVSDYEVSGLPTVYRTKGLGVPLIAVRRHESTTSCAEPFYPPSLSFACSAFLRVMPEQTTLTPEGTPVHRAVLEIVDPLTSLDIEVAGQRVPLESDLSTPLAYFLDNSLFNGTNLGNWGMIRPDTSDDLRGVYMLEPFDPSKIPVVMVHGLRSSPTTWTEMYNDLRAMPEIRNNYQIWFYLYPTGQPFWISAAQMRDDLERMRQCIDPHHAAPALDEMVVVGHSLGGLVATMQTVDSGDAFWQRVGNRPFEELDLESESRDDLARLVYFQANPSIKRVITIGAPMRGSNYANDATRWLARHIFTLPSHTTLLAREVRDRNPGALIDDGLIDVRTSIDSLSPESPGLPALLEAQRAPWVRHHNIVGLIEPENWLKELTYEEGDGFVTLASARLENADSELQVRAEHRVMHRHPRTVLEVRRILLEHVDELRRQAGATAVRPLPAVLLGSGYLPPPERLPPTEGSGTVTR